MDRERFTYSAIKEFNLNEEMVKNVEEYNNNWYYNDTNSIFIKKNFDNEYSEVNYLPVKNDDDEETKNEKEKNMINVRNKLRNSDTGGDFFWRRKGYLKASPFIVNRGVFFNSRELHNGDSFRFGENSNLNSYERIVVSFKLKEIITKEEVN